MLILLKIVARWRRLYDSNSPTTRGPSFPLRTTTCARRRPAHTKRAGSSWYTRKRIPPLRVQLQSHCQRRAELVGNRQFSPERRVLRTRKRSTFFGAYEFRIDFMHTPTQVIILPPTTIDQRDLGMKG